jgi:hypothetical protein
MRRKRPLGWIQKIRARPGISVRSLGHRVSMVLLGLLLAMGAVGCASLERLPAVKLAQAPNADILNISDVRFYTTDTARMTAIAVAAYQRRSKIQHASEPQNFLAISGGGDDGAFGAGLLVGWSERGDRPNFGVVTGVSTGALSAPFAYLGRGYDQHLKQVYRFKCRRDIQAAYASRRSDERRHGGQRAIATDDRSLHRRRGGPEHR